MYSMFLLALYINAMMAQTVCDETKGDELALVVGNYLQDSDVSSCSDIAFPETCDKTLSELGAAYDVDPQQLSLVLAWRGLDSGERVSTYCPCSCAHFDSIQSTIGVDSTGVAASPSPAIPSTPVPVCSEPLGDAFAKMFGEFTNRPDINSCKAVMPYIYELMGKIGVNHPLCSSTLQEIIQGHSPSVSSDEIRSFANRFGVSPLQSFADFCPCSCPSGCKEDRGDSFAKMFGAFTNRPELNSCKTMMPFATHLLHKIGYNKPMCSSSIKEIVQGHSPSVSDDEIKSYGVEPMQTLDEFCPCSCLNVIPASIPFVTSFGVCEEGRESIGDNFARIFGQSANRPEIDSCSSAMEFALSKIQHLGINSKAKICTSSVKELVNAYSPSMALPEIESMSTLLGVQPKTVLNLICPCVCLAEGVTPTTEIIEPTESIVSSTTEPVPTSTSFSTEKVQPTTSTSKKIITTLPATTEIVEPTKPVPASTSIATTEKVQPTISTEKVQPMVCNEASGAALTQLISAVDPSLNSCQSLAKESFCEMTVLQLANQYDSTIDAALVNQMGNLYGVKSDDLIKDHCPCSCRIISTEISRSTTEKVQPTTSTTKKIITTTEVSPSTTEKADPTEISPSTTEKADPTEILPSTTEKVDPEISTSLAISTTLACDESSGDSLAQLVSSLNPSLTSCEAFAKESFCEMTLLLVTNQYMPSMDAATLNMMVQQYGVKSDDLIKDHCPCSCPASSTVDPTEISPSSTEVDPTEISPSTTKKVDPTEISPSTTKKVDPTEISTTKKIITTTVCDESSGENLAQLVATLNPSLNSCQSFAKESFCEMTVHEVANQYMALEADFINTMGMEHGIKADDLVKDHCPCSCKPVQAGSTTDEPETTEMIPFENGFLVIGEITVENMSVEQFEKNKSFLRSIIADELAISVSQVRLYFIGGRRLLAMEQTIRTEMLVDSLEEASRVEKNMQQKEFGEELTSKASANKINIKSVSLSGVHVFSLTTTSKAVSTESVSDEVALNANKAEGTASESVELNANMEMILLITVIGLIAILSVVSYFLVKSKLAKGEEAEITVRSLGEYSLSLKKDGTEGKLAINYGTGSDYGSEYDTTPTIWEGIETALGCAEQSEVEINIESKEITLETKLDIYEGSSTFASP